MYGPISQDNYASSLRWLITAADRRCPGFAFAFSSSFTLMIGACCVSVSDFSSFPARRYEDLDTDSARRAQDRQKRSLPLWIRLEIQKMSRTTPCFALNRCFTETLTMSPTFAANKTVTLSIPTMDCEVCPITVKKALGNVIGVSRIDVNPKKRIVVTTFDDAQTNAAALIKTTKSVE